MFVCFLGESAACKPAYGFIWPLHRAEIQTFFVRILGEMMTSLIHSKIAWPLGFFFGKVRNNGVERWYHDSSLPESNFIVSRMVNRIGTFDFPSNWKTNKNCCSSGHKNLGAFLEKKNFNFSPNLIYLMTGTFATRGATWEDFCRHLRSAHLCNSHQLATLSIILNEFGFRLGKKEKVLNISF